MFWPNNDNIFCTERPSVSNKAKVVIPRLASRAAHSITLAVYRDRKLVSAAATRLHFPCRADRRMLLLQSRWMRCEFCRKKWLDLRQNETENH